LPIKECLEIELGLQAIPFQARHELRLVYKERQLSKKFELDFLCYDLIVVEIKAASEAGESPEGARFDSPGRSAAKPWVCAT